MKHNEIKKLVLGISKNMKPYTKWVELKNKSYNDIIIEDDIVGIVQKDKSLKELEYTEMWSIIDGRHKAMIRDKKLNKLGL